MALEIISFLNEPVNSNTFIVWDNDTKQCLVIDPGSAESKSITDFLDAKRLVPDFILLTHEHFDHVWSVDVVRKKYQSKVVSSKICSEAITNPKKNHSLFYNQTGFAIGAADILVENINYCLPWGNYNIRFLPTPGHSDSGISILINQYLFPGDTIIYGERTVVKLPTGSTQKLKQSVDLIINNIEDSTTIFGGHGQPFHKKDIDIQTILGIKR